MERKNRNILVVLIAAVIVVAVFSSFGLNLFPKNYPHIVLPTAAPTGMQPIQPSQEGEGVTWIGVTPDTVQSVVSTLKRPDNYYREITVRYGADGGTLTAQVWVDGGWTRTDAVNSRSGLVRHTIVGDGMLYYWYNNDQTARSAPADEKSPDLDGPHIPTFEDVLSLDKSLITGAGYEEKDGENCVYVSVRDEELDQEQRYWISTGSYCLLIAAEITRGDEVLMSMSSSAMEQPVPADASFALPDGTVLHTVTGPESAAGPT